VGHLRERYDFRSLTWCPGRKHPGEPIPPYGPRSCFPLARIATRHCPFTFYLRMPQFECGREDPSARIPLQPRNQLSLIAGVADQGAMSRPLLSEMEGGGVDVQ
jgi:hypothetical protein